MAHLQKKEKVKIFKETGDPWNTYQNEVDRACFEHDIALKI